jgi:hypothetical protein
MRRGRHGSNRMQRGAAPECPRICTRQMNVQMALHLHEMSGKMAVCANHEDWLVTSAPRGRDEVGQLEPGH